MKYVCLQIMTSNFITTENGAGILKLRQWQMDETQYDRFWTHFQLFGKRDARADATTRHHSARKACRGFGFHKIEEVIKCKVLYRDTKCD